MISQRKTEDDYIRDWTRVWPVKPGVVGVGDDCAVLPALPADCVPVLKTDALVERVHFLPTDAPRRVGYKALARVLSDFGAMGATPAAAVVSVGFPLRETNRKSTAYMKALYAGMARLAQDFEVLLVGGETTRSTGFWLNVSATGWVRKDSAVLRSTARSGDRLFVTGELGGSYPRRHLTFEPRVQEGQWLAQNHLATAMMDLSDGLGKDLPRLAKASKVSYAISSTAIPVRRGCGLDNAINDGEDYELLFTVDSSKTDRLLKEWPFTVRIHEIGCILSAKSKSVTEGLDLSGFDHFRKPRRSQ